MSSLVVFFVEWLCSDAEASPSSGGTLCRARPTAAVGCCRRQTVGRMECERRGKFRRGCHMTEETQDCLVQ